MQDFLQLGLPQPLLHALEKMQFRAPTPIQAQAIPVALAGGDVLGSAQTGTGKTGAFGIPLIARLLEDPQASALVMTPTRELAAQVVQMLQKLSEGTGIRSALLIGGDSMHKQLQQLRQRPRLIVGTPGRINDHLEQRSVRFDNARFLVLDETDRMLDMGFGPQIDRILKHMPQRRQTLLFSATLPAHIVKLSEKYLHQPRRIAVGSVHIPVEKIKQEVVHTAVADKYNQLLAQLGQRQGSVIVFVKTKRGADRLAKKLNDAKHSAEAIHGNLSQNKRTRVIADFRAKKHRVMVATDVAARGLDIPHIEHVVNYDLPQVPEDYIHRIGRTARAGAEGSAVCFVTPEDRDLWQAVQQLLNPSLKPAPRAPQQRQGQRQGQRPGQGQRHGGGQRYEHGRDGNRNKNRNRNRGRNRPGRAA